MRMSGFIPFIAAAIFVGIVSRWIVPRNHYFSLILCILVGSVITIVVMDIAAGQAGELISDPIGWALYRLVIFALMTIAGFLARLILDFCWRN